MYRVVCRDHVCEAEIRSVWHLDTTSVSPATGAPEVSAPQRIELDPADFRTVGPYLLMIGAQQHAEEIIAEAKVEAESIRAAAKHDAIAASIDTARQDLQPAATAFANAAQALIVLEEQLLTVYRPDLVRLALQIAEKIVGRTVLEHPEIVRFVLEKARKETVNAREIRIWLNPADRDLLAHVAPDVFQSRGASGRQIEVLSSDDIARGGCRLETEMGVIDATLPTQIEEIHRGLLDEERKSA